MNRTSLLLNWALMVSVLAGCATGGARSGKTAATTAVREPSPLDPKNLPAVTVGGLANGDLIVAAPLKIQVGVSNYPMDRNWQWASVAVNEAVPEKIYASNSWLELRDGLREGLNVLRVYLARSTGESVKSADAVVVRNFYFQKKDPKSAADTGPSIYIVSPQGVYAGDKATKIMFDFLVSGTQLGARKNRVHYTLNGERRELSNWDSYSFQNLTPGSYSLKVELVDSVGKTLKGSNATHSTSFTVEK